MLYAFSRLGTDENERKETKMLEIPENLTNEDMDEIAVLGFGKLGKRVINLGIEKEENGVMGRFIEGSRFMSEETTLHYSNLLSEAKTLIILFDWETPPFYVLPLIEAAHQKEILILGIASRSLLRVETNRDFFERLLACGMDSVFTIYECALFNGQELLPEEVALKTINSVAELINTPGVINLEMDDLIAQLKEKRYFQVGMGLGLGENKAFDAIKQAYGSCWNKQRMEGASNYVLNVIGDISLTDVSDMEEYVKEHSEKQADIIFGCRYSEDKPDYCEVVLIASGFDKALQ